MGWRSAPSRTYTGPLLADARRVAFLWSPVLRLPRSPLCRFAGPPSLPSPSPVAALSIYLSIYLLSGQSRLWGDKR